MGYHGEIWASKVLEKNVATPAEKIFCDQQVTGKKNIPGELWLYIRSIRVSFLWIKLGIEKLPDGL